MTLKQILFLFMLSFLSIAYNPLAHAQTEITVSGVITEAETGEPLPGGNIYISGMPERGTVSNPDGSYSLRVNSDETLVFSYIGFITRQIAVGGRTTLNVTSSEERRVEQRR